MTVGELVEAVPPGGGLLGGLRRVGRGLLRLPRGAAATATLAWAWWIWWHSSKEGDLSVDPDFWWGWFTNLGHAPAFAFVALGLLVVALQRAVHAGREPRVDARTAAVVLGLTVAYGAVDEVHQSFVYGRTASFLDLLTDTLGASSTVWVVAYLLRRGATNAGLAARLAVGAAACILSALAATLAD